MIFILTDDQGYGDIGCMGNSDIITPNMDRLHSRSISFTNYHSSTTSAPTRSGLLTGHYNNATGVWHTVQGRSILDSEEYTLAQAFSDAGYSTAIFGKWHLGDDYPYRPQDRGFDMSLIHGGGGVGQTPDYWNNTYFDDTYLRNGAPEKMSGYCTDVWFAEAAKFIEARERDGKPFFCYLSTNAPHGPFNVEAKYEDLYKGNKNVVNPRFYGMITNLDENLGALMDRIESSKLADNTIIIFSTDNGTSSGVNVDKRKFVTEGYGANMRGKKGSNYEGGHRVPLFINIPGQMHRSVDVLTSYVDFMPTLVDLCGLSIPDGYSFDGVSMQPLIYGGSFPEDRMLGVDRQRDSYLVKYKSRCVMQGSWRLVNENELYDVAIDPEQRNDISAQHPGQVARMQEFYEGWWVRNASRADEFQYIGVNPDGGTTLTVHDQHVEPGKRLAVDQGQIRRGQNRSNGHWCVEISDAGEYEISLYRWPPSTGGALCGALAEGRAVPNGSPAEAGRALNIVNGRVSVGKVELCRGVDSAGEQTHIPFVVKLEPGEYNLQGEFTDDNGEIFSAYYVHIERAGGDQSRGR